MSKKLEEATQNLLNFIQMKSDSLVDHKYDLKLKKGQCNLIGLRNTDNVSISLARYNDICESEWHAHEEREVFIMYCGEPYIMEMDVDGKITSFEVNNSPAYIDPCVKHRMIKNTSGESRSIVILIPGSSTFPKGYVDEQW